MQNNLLTPVVVLFSLILIANIVIICNLFKLRKNADNNKVFSDERYFDLKLQIRYLMLIIITFGSVFAFLGWNVKSQIIEELKEEVLTDTKEEVTYIAQIADSLSLAISKLENSYIEQSNKINKLSSDNYKLKEKFKSLDEEVDKRLSNISTLVSIYIVTDIMLYDVVGVNRFYYKDLKPINSNKLPKFKEPPIVDIQTSTGLVLNVVENTKDYIEVRPIIGTGKHCKLTLWIVER